MNEQLSGDDYTAAVPLEISQETAERAEEVLRIFAEDAEMDMALVVDRSGSLVAGIAADASVSVDTISALVAGVCGAVDALVGEIGDSGEIESFHSGGERQLYLRELENRFILVGVSDADLPAGIIRQKSAQIRGELSELLQDIQATSAAAAASAKRRRSLHSIVPVRKQVEEPEPGLEPETAVEPETGKNFDSSDDDEEASDIVLEASAVDEPRVSLDAVGAESPFSLDSEAEEPSTGAGIRFDDLSGLTEPEDELVDEAIEEEGVEEPSPVSDPFELDNSGEESEEPVAAAETIAEAEPELEEEEKPLYEGVVEEETAKAPFEEPTISPPVLVAPVVVNSPFEAVDDDEDEIEMVESSDDDEEVILPSQPGPSIGKSGDEGPRLNIPKPLPVKKSSAEEDDEEPAKPRKSGPKYSFELG